MTAANVATWENAVTIPAAQSAITGTLTGLAAAAGATLAHLESPAAVGFLTFGAVTLASWLSYRRDWAHRLDVVTGVQDELQLARMESSTIRLEVISDNGRAGDYLNLPGGREKLLLLARGINAGRPLTVRTWTGSGGIYTPNEFDQVRGVLIERGYACWRSPHDNRGGAVLTHAGKAVMRYLANLDATRPTPADLPRVIKLQNPGLQTPTHTHTARIPA